MKYLELLIYIWVIGVCLCIPYAYNKFWAEDYDSIVDFMVVILPTISIILSLMGIFSLLRKGRV